MPDFNELNELHFKVRSKILEQIQEGLAESGRLAASTQYTKSDGTNYGMYQKGDSSLTDIWDIVINQRSMNVSERLGKIQGPPG
jgi:hypothetical protein